MKKTSKRIAGIAVVVLLIAVALVGAGSADYPGTGTQVDPWWCGADTGSLGHASDSVTAWLDSNGKLTISGDGAMYDYSYSYSYSNRAPWYDSSSGITSVVIGNSVQTIGRCAFYNCTNMESVSIGNGVVSIGNYAFDSCTSLTSITIPNNVTTIYGGAFCYTGIIECFIPAGVTSIDGGAFSGCNSLKQIEVAENNSSYCSVDGVLFSKDMKKLVRYPNGKKDSVSEELLTSYSIPNSVTIIKNSAFDTNPGLISITIPDSVKTIEWDAFSSCEKLKSLVIPKSVETIGDYAFEYSSSLESVSIIGNGSTTIGDYAFYECSGLKSVSIGNGVTTIGDYAFAVYEGTSSLENVTIGDHVETIGYCAFDCCISLESVSIPNSVETIGDYAFDYCINLESVSIGNSVTSIGEGAFWDCTPLKSVIIPNSVETIGDYAFRESINLTYVAIEGNPSIGNNAFDLDDGYSSPVPSNAVFYLTENITPTENMQYVVHLNGGKLKSGFEQDDKKLPTPSKLTKYGYTFGGWYDNPGFTSPHSGEDIISGTPVYAKWNQIHVTGVSLDKTAMTLPVGDSGTLTATVTPSDALVKSVSWSSDNEDVATVDQSGKVTAVGAGEATITVTTTDGGLTATCKVTVVVPVTGVTLDKETTKIAVKKTDQLTATVEPENATDKSVSWSSSDENVATVDETGLVTAVGNGTATITVTTHDGEFTASCEVTVYTPSSGSSVTSFSSEKNGNDFTFKNAVVITKMTLPGATYAKVTNTSGSGWYNCSVSTDGTAGIAYFQVPLDVLNVKGYTVNDVSFAGSTTTYLKSEGGYAKYSAPVTGSGSYSIAFVKGAATAVVETPVTTDYTQGYLKITSVPAGATIQIEGVDYIGYTPQEKISLNPGTYTVTLSLDGYEDTVKTVIISDDATSTVTADLKQKSGTTATTAAKTPFPVLGILAGLGAAAFFLRRR